MTSKALICDENQVFSLADVVLPEPGPDRLRVRTLRSGVSIGTEFALIRRKLDWGPYPLCTGYQAVGCVEEVGENVEGFAVGDLVYYRDGKHLALPDGTAISSVAGTHAAHAIIHPKETHGLAHLPAGCDLDAASLYVMPAVGLAGVDMANPRMGSTVLVYGCGQIGLGVVAACVLRGAKVIAVDISDDALALAAKFGADHLINAKAGDLEEAVHAIVPAGADTVFECTGIPACLDITIPLARTLGGFVLQGNYGAAPITYSFLPAHGRRLTWYYPCDDGQAPCRRAVVKLMASGALPWQEVITHRVKAADSAEFYDQINHGAVPGLVGGVIDWE